MQPSVHFLEFTDGIDPVGHPDRFHVLWHLDATAPPQSKPSDDVGSDETTRWGGISAGDLVVFPSLLSGAGEFEGVRFVGPKDDEDGTLPLLTAGIEGPEFPTLIVSLAEEKGASLRDLYEAPFDAVLASHPPRLTLFDVFSRDEEAYNEFWTDVPIARRRRPPGGDPWRFSLGECVWIRTLDGKGLVKGGKEEL